MGEIQERERERDGGADQTPSYPGHTWLRASETHTETPANPRGVSHCIRGEAVSSEDSRS